MKYDPTAIPLLALVLQQLHFRLQIVIADPKHPNWHDGKPWFGQAWSHWQALEFPFWGERTIRDYFATLKDMDLVEMRQHWSQKHDQRTYMTINWDHPLLQGEPVQLPTKTAHTFLTGAISAGIVPGPHRQLSR